MFVCVSAVRLRGSSSSSKNNGSGNGRNPKLGSRRCASIPGSRIANTLANSKGNRDKHGSSSSSGSNSSSSQCVLDDRSSTQSSDRFNTQCMSTGDMCSSELLKTCNSNSYSGCFSSGWRSVGCCNNCRMYSNVSNNKYA